jgi:anti-sigma-K factor RskA
MISEEKQDLAVEYAFGMMDAAASRAFEAELKSDEELCAFAMELRESAAAMARWAPAQLPPPGLRERILAQVRGEVAVAAAVAQATAVGRPPDETSAANVESRVSFLPWVIAAGLAITSAALWVERDQWKNEALSLRTEAIALRERDEFSQLKIAMLAAQNAAYAKAGAVVLWDEAKQRGVIKLSNFPAAGTGKDYQLWVIESKKDAVPVSGGVVAVGANGIARVSFSPDHPVRKAEKFAISIEQEGGAPKVEGPVILAGD